MDTLVSSALEEICSHGSSGLSLPSLLTILNPTPSLSLKAALWTSLLSIPTLQFTVPLNGEPLSPSDPKIQFIEDAERLNLKIVANEHLRNCFVGLYDTPSSSINLNQRRTLDRLAVSRAKGITQSQLAKEFGVEGKNFFYTVRNLEGRGLIVRQPAVVKTKEVHGEGETRSSASVTTNLIYLCRYAKHLGVQQKFEISKEERTLGSLGDAEEIDVGDVTGESFEDDVLIRDYLPAMKTICDKLDQANDKILVVSDIKKNLGYSGRFGHRAWRNICRRLKAVRIVEEFEAKVNDKVERCLRLLKKFSSKNFEDKCIGSGDHDNKEPVVKFGRKFQQTEQLVELPIDNQIYDMIDAAGTEGIYAMEVCGRLGLDKKKSYPRFHNMVSRSWLHVQAGNHKKTVAYRAWSCRNYNPELLDTSLGRSKSSMTENKISNMDIGNLDVPDRSTEAFLEYDNSTCRVDISTPVKLYNNKIETKLSHSLPKDGKTNHMLHCPGNVPDYLQEQRGTASDADLDLVNMEMETNAAPSETTTPTLLKPPSSVPARTYPHSPLTSDGALREHRILERLQEEKFILRPELYRWLVSLEKDKCTTMDRKTIDRILIKLQKEGHCKCVDMNVPVVTNCSRDRITRVVLHPSIQNFPPELVSDIHDRLRSFEKQIRGQCSSRWKNSESIPVLNSVVRTQTPVSSDDKAAKSEAMRANGYVLARMVRAKLLHVFLWEYLSGPPGWHDDLSPGINVRPYKLFALEAAVKAIPIELFLQVAGSTQKFDDMIEKCKKGLHLSDLPVEEYKCLMDMQATGRLSLLIDLLRRLKLIRLVRDGSPEDGVRVPHAACTHALELKPYVEEPISVIATSNLIAFDLRPRIRHDFTLSNRDAVDEYWKTLEYCYAAADPEAALHAFPGSAVPEVFLQRSWASVRVMSADQRAELLKLVAKDVNKKISYNECEKIAKDLNLTLQQVLRVFYDKHHRRLNRFRGVVNANEDYQLSNRKLTSFSRKRKKSLEPSSMKHARVDTIDEQLVEEGLTISPSTVDQVMEEQKLSSSGEHDDHLQVYQEDDSPETGEESRPSKDEDCYSLISEHMLSKLPRQSRFLWTDEADRQLVIQYVRQRAALGAKFNRIDWTVLTDLPAPPKSCARRMSSLNRNAKFRKALMKLCTMLSERYVKHLEKTQSMSLNDSICLVRSTAREGLEGKFSDGVEHCKEVDPEDHWDDFNEKSIKKTFEDVLRYKQTAKLEVPKQVSSAPEEWSKLNKDVEEYNPLESELVSSSMPSEDAHHLGSGKHNDSTKRSRCHRLNQKFIKLFNEGTGISRQVHKSLAVSNAVELLKLVFLSTSTAPELQDLLAETLRRYSEHDLFAAFSYLRAKKIMIGGNDGQPFVLSQQFLHSVSRSPFPATTGKRAAKFSGWLHEREKDLVEVGINLYADLQCGDIFQLFALVCSGELSVSPIVPEEGVGEAEQRSLKRKAEDDELCNVDKAKKLKSWADSELVSRREKGFPGITVSVHRATISMVNAVELFKDDETSIGELHWKDQFSVDLGQKNSCSSALSNHVPEIPNFGGCIPTAGLPSKSPWDAMASYAEYLMPKPCDPKEASLFNPGVFRTVYNAIQKAGDQGLSMEEVAQVADMPGANLHEYIIDVLLAFGRVLKVNAYESVCIVDALYRSKYFLTSLSGFLQDLKPHSVTDSLERRDKDRPISLPENHDVVGASSQWVMSEHDVHKVTILNLPEDVVPLNESQSRDEHEGHLLDVLPGQNNDSETHKISSGELCMPILPWINGDGTINKVVYNGHVRRILGTVMQNPGILEDDIVHRIDVLNPQSCRSLLELMVLDKHLIVRKMRQSTSTGLPALLGTLLGNNSREPKVVLRKHFFANPMRASFL